MSPSSSSAANRAFADLGLGPELLQTLSSLGYEEPTPIQRAAIPHLLKGRDLLGLAATGTGCGSIEDVDRGSRQRRAYSMLIL